MIIPRYARKNFEPNEKDDKKTALQKKYYLEKDRIDRELLEITTEEPTENEVKSVFDDILKNNK